MIWAKKLLMTCCCQISSDLNAPARCFATMENATLDFASTLTIEAGPTEHFEQGRVEDRKEGLVDHWRVEIELNRTGADNMARDEKLARELLANSALPNVLRLYTWNPYAISLGYQQSDHTIDYDAAREAGVDVVRRPTGGRAVYHSEELTYCVVLRSEISDGIYAVHNRITRALLASLRHLDSTALHLELTGATNDTRMQYQGAKPTNMACFASASRHEVLFDGRKLLGSAQRRFGEVVLQHGSILLGNEHARLPEFLKLDERSRAEMRLLLLEQTATLGQALSRSVSAIEAADCLREHFVDEFRRPEGKEV